MTAPVRARKCSSGKVPFRSQGEARRALDRIALTDQQAAVPSVKPPCQAYRCRCGAWHLTSQTPEESRAHAERGMRTRRTVARRARRKRRAARAPLVLRVVPALPPAPAPAVVPAPSSWLPHDPISEARKSHWAAQRAEVALARAIELGLRPNTGQSEAA